MDMGGRSVDLFTPIQGTEYPVDNRKRLNVLFEIPTFFSFLKSHISVAGTIMTTEKQEAHLERSDTAENKAKTSEPSTTLPCNADSIQDVEYPIGLRRATCITGLVFGASCYSLVSSKVRHGDFR